MSPWRRSVTGANRAAAVPGSAAGGKPSRLRTQHAAELVREQWRCAAADAERALHDWRDAGVRERTGAAIAYLASLDREERAAADYRAAYEAAHVDRT